MQIDVVKPSAGVIITEGQTIKEGQKQVGYSLHFTFKVKSQS